MKKAEMRARLAAAEENIRVLNRARAIEKEGKAAAFEEAVDDLRNGLVLIVTPTGKQVRGLVLDLVIEQDQVDVSRSSTWAEFLPGRRTVSLRVGLQPL